MTDDEQPPTPATPADRDPMAVQYFPGPSDGPNAATPSLPVVEAVPTVPPPAGPLAPPVPVQGTVPPVPPAPPIRRRRGVRTWVWAILGVVVVGLLVAQRISLNYYAIQPGTAQSVQPFITVPADKAHPVTHPVLLTDVREARVTALTYLYFKLASNTALYSVPAVTGGTAPDELDAQGALEMSQAEQAAKTSALRHLGYTVPATPAGAVIAGTFPGTPAYGVLNVGDVVTALDGTPTPTAQALSTQLGTHHSGQTVTFTVRKGGTGSPGPVPLTLRATKVNVGGQTVTLTVGIEPEDQVNYTYPFPISINVVDIGGPSAGLAMTLGVIDALSSGSLTGGHTVAATGTMDAAGDVGDVGGVAQKTVAVENAGASIFLVPPQEYGAAMSKDRPGLKIYAVSTLDQALRVLEANGGRVGPTALDAASSGSAG
jgi:PDZ domain-containing protein